MAFEDADFAWLGTPAVEETPAETETPTPEEIAKAAETPVETPTELPEKTETPAVEDTADIPLKVTQLVDDLGGEDAARQLLPLVRAIQQADPENQQEAGELLAKGIREVLDDAQWASLLWDNFGKYGQIFTEQYLAENPNFLKEQGFVKAGESAPDDDQDDDDPYADDKPSKLELEVKQLREQLQELTGKEQQTAAQKQAAEEASRQQSVVQKANATVFGEVVNKSFAELGWSDDEAREAYDLAMAKFNRDTKAVEAYQKTVRYQATGNKMLAGFQVTAKTAFANYLSASIKTVGAGRTQTSESKTPIPPTRKEIASTAPGIDTKTPATGAEGNPFKVNPNDLLSAVRNRLQARQAAR